MTCTGQVVPGTETCNGADDNCNGTADEPFTSQFQITTLAATGCAIIDHNSSSGDDRGGIAISGGNVFYSGDSSTTRIPLNLSSQSAIGRIYDAMSTDLRTETAYTLGNGATPIPNGGGTATTIIPINSAGVMGTPIALSTSFSTGSSAGIFAGYGRILVHNGSRVYEIAVPSGVVRDLGVTPVPAHFGCESWAYWGVAETIGGVSYISYVNSNSIQRMRVPTGAVTTVATFSNLSDMCSFTVSPSTNRWYFHHEGGSQFGGSAETLGYCSATFSTSSVSSPIA